MSATFWLPAVHKSTESEKQKEKHSLRTRQDSTSSSSSSSSSSSASSDSSTASSSTSSALSERSKKSKIEKKEELQAVYEDFMPAEEEEPMTSEISQEPELNESLKEVLQRLNQDLDAYSKLKTKLKLPSKSESTESSKNAHQSQPGPSLTHNQSQSSQESKKRKVPSKKELTKLRRERDQLKKKVLSLTKIGQNYQAKLNNFFTELSKQDS